MYSWHNNKRVRTSLRARIQLIHWKADSFSSVHERSSRFGFFLQAHSNYLLQMLTSLLSSIRTIDNNYLRQARVDSYEQVSLLIFLQLDEYSIWHWSIFREKYINIYLLNNVINEHKQVAKKSWLHQCGVLMNPIISGTNHRFIETR